MRWGTIIALTTGLVVVVPAIAGASHAAVAACRLPDLSIRKTEKVILGTGLPGRVLRLTNVGDRSCALGRWPRFALLDKRGVLPYLTRYNRQCVWLCRPRDKHVRQSALIVVSPRGSVYLGFHQYRCDLGTKRVAGSARIVFSPAASSGVLFIRISRYPILGYCGKGDPGSILYVSPFEPTYGTAVSRM
jgi:hypothetical protein